MKIKDSWIFLSYELDNSLSMYGNGERIQIQKVRDINEGDTSNNTFLNLHSHYGTHIDFPFHFDADGKTGSYYQADFFIFNNIKIVQLNNSMEGLLIGKNDFNSEDIPTDTDLILFKTGLTNKRLDDTYWSHNYGFLPEIGKILRERLPNLKSIGFDSISLTSYQHREIGRAAHKEFLINNNILIIEDMNLEEVTDKTILNKVIISPLRFKDADGAPVTVFAQLNNK